MNIWIHPGPAAQRNPRRLTGSRTACQQAARNAKEGRRSGMGSRAVIKAASALRRVVTDARGRTQERPKVPLGRFPAFMIGYPTTPGDQPRTLPAAYDGRLADAGPGSRRESIPRLSRGYPADASFRQLSPVVAKSFDHALRVACWRVLTPILCLGAGGPGFKSPHPDRQNLTPLSGSLRRHCPR